MSMKKIESNKDKVIEKSKYKSFAEWRKASPNAYAAAKRRGMFKEISERFGWKMPKVYKRKPKLKYSELNEIEKRLLSKVWRRKWLNKSDMKLFESMYQRGFDFGKYPELYILSQK